MNVLESNGKSEARVYAVMAIPPPRPEPRVEIERVLIGDPRHTSTVRRGAADAGAGPRNADQRSWPPASAPGVDLPDALPATKAQRIVLDPELVARWRAEAQTKESA